MINCVNLIGRLTKDVDLRKMTDNKSVAYFTLAVERPKKQGAATGVDYIQCKAFGAIADAAYRYLRKGSLMGVKGRIRTGSYDKDGIKHYTTDVIVEDMQFLSRAETEQQAQPKPQYQNYAYEQSADIQPSFSGDIEITADDLPF